MLRTKLGVHQCTRVSALMRTQFGVNTRMFLCFSCFVKQIGVHQRTQAGVLMHTYFRCVCRWRWRCRPHVMHSCRVGEHSEEEKTSKAIWKEEERGSGLYRPYLPWVLCRSAVVLSAHKFFLKPSSLDFCASSYPVRCVGAPFIF